MRGFQLLLPVEDLPSVVAGAGEANGFRVGCFQILADLICFWLGFFRGNLENEPKQQIVATFFY